MYEESSNLYGWIEPPKFKDFFDKVGIHTTNKYDVKLSLSPHMSKVFINSGFMWHEINDLVSFTLTNVTIPNGAINTTAVRTYGENFEMPYSKSYDTSNFTHYLDNNGKIHKFYNVWMREIYDPYTRTVGYNSNYACDISLLLYRRVRIMGEFKHEPFIEITMEKAYPKSVNPFSMQGLSGNAPTQFDVTMVCRRIFANYRDTPIRSYANQN